jgi:hypothetical protein
MTVHFVSRGIRLTETRFDHIVHILLPTVDGQNCQKVAKYMTNVSKGTISPTCKQVSCVTQTEMLCFRFMLFF